MAQTVTIPYAPRPFQRALHELLWTNRFVVAVCHRRFGKTVLGINHLVRCALTLDKTRPRFAYIGPTYRQAKAVAWDYLKFYTRDIPGVQVNESELRVDFPNGGQVRLYGGDSPDSLRGIYLDGAVVDEYGMHQGDLFSSVLRPLLADRQGWALLLGTPNGQNQFYDIAEYAKVTEGWRYAEFKASQTDLIPLQELASARSVMTEDEYQQEFECSFTAAVKGAYYAKELDAAQASGRITSVPADPVLPVHTFWDLGIGDSMAIWFAQRSPGGEVRLVDYYENSGEGIPHYVSKLHEKGYTYGNHWAPHDINVRELSTGRSRHEAAKALGVTFKLTPKLGVDDGIHAARMLFPRCWFDQARCAPGLDALRHYRKNFNVRLQEFTDAPVHDKASHGADAFRYLAVALESDTTAAPPSYADLFPTNAGAFWRR